MGSIWGPLGAAGIPIWHLWGHLGLPYGPKGEPDSSTGFPRMNYVQPKGQPGGTKFPEWLKNDQHVYLKLWIVLN